ncbi:hypothetical protein WISP_13225 [Willisornis vidua]|uniref:Uncharacterized protein n=1 Tax=Willisornis vidua TaxID=1566151 RepID=A0ABQ9DWZ2_9PASS|nr:hypothetical protein WISP_13225 [Willisornis vidua]
MNTWWIRNWLGSHTKRVTINGLTSKWRTVTSSVLQGLVLRPMLLNIFVSDMDSGIECNDSSTDLQSLWREGMPSLATSEGLRDDPVQTSWSLTRSSARSCICNRKCKYILGRDWIDSIPEEKDLELMGKKFNMTQQFMLADQKPAVSWAASKAVWPAG